MGVTGQLLVLNVGIPTVKEEEGKDDAADKLFELNNNGVFVRDVFSMVNSKVLEDPPACTLTGDAVPNLQVAISFTGPIPMLTAGAEAAVAFFGETVKVTLPLPDVVPGFTHRV